MVMTPNDILNKRFEKGMGGYRTEEVHQFLGQVADYVSELEGERVELQNKMEFLADKLEEYKEDEDSLRAALVGAQKLGDNVVREAKRKAEAIIADAVRKAEEIASDAQTRIDAEAVEFEKIRSEVVSFKKNLIRLYRNHLKLIEALPDDNSPIEPPRISYTPIVEIAKPTGAQDEEDSPGMMDEVMAVAAASTQEESATTGLREQVSGFAERAVEPKAPKIPDMSDAKEDAKMIGAVQLELEPEPNPGPPEQPEPQRRTSRLRYDKLNQFFGEDNPVERE